MKKTLILLTLLLAAGCAKQPASAPVDQPAEQPTAQTEKPVEAVAEQGSNFTVPISDADSRVTKKPFGIYITPKTSPVQPEKFTGYHTGTDFETFANEKGVAVPVFAICSGKVVSSRFVNGYGGNAIIQCEISGQTVTVIYGHLKVSSLPKIGTVLKTGDKVAVLGEVGNDTDGERKHLHLGIHEGSAIELRGYVQSQKELENWLDYQKLD
jgi:murein DD-endopeptidase MepM/ murein hydrolase activator NlpD